MPETTDGGKQGLVIELPGRPALQLRHLLLDFNGTLAGDGELLDDVGPRLQKLNRQLEVEVLTADTFGTAQALLKPLGINCTVVATGTDKAKRAHILGGQSVIAIGNGVNDIGMLKSAGLSIATLGPGGLASAALAAADVVATDIISALDLLLVPKRLLATLRE